MRPLPELQREMLRAITSAHDHAGTAAADLAVLDEIRGNERLSAVGRLDVYARMYCARLIDALKEDYPRVRAVLGDEAFTETAHAYVEAYPSQHPSLRWFGDRFAEFLERGAIDGAPAFLADLARLEWMRLAVFDAADVPVLDLEGLRRIPPEAWAGLRLRFVPAVETLVTAWPVHQIWEAVEHGTPVSEFQVGATRLRVWRQGDRVFQAGMDDVEHMAFAAVVADETFAELCERLAAVVSAEAAAATAGSLTLRWLDDGVLAAPPES